MKDSDNDPNNLEASEEAEELACLPHEVTRSMNLQVSKADFGHWADMDSWSLKEAALLSVGRDPRRVSWCDDVKAYENVSLVAREVLERHDALKRSVGAKLLKRRPSPAEFDRWARSKKLVLVKLNTEARELSEISLDSELLTAEVVIPKIFEVACKIIEDEGCLFCEAENPGDKIRLVNQFLQYSLAWGFKRASAREWLNFADWFCFPVARKFRDESKILDIRSADSVAPTLNKKQSSWVVKVREFAEEILDNESFTQEKLATIIADKLASEGLKTDKNKPITAEYVRRLAFTTDGWWKAQKSKRKSPRVT